MVETKLSISNNRFVCMPDVGEMFRPLFHRLDIEADRRQNKHEFVSAAGEMLKPQGAWDRTAYVSAQEVQ